MIHVFELKVAKHWIIITIHYSILVSWGLACKVAQNYKIGYCDKTLLPKFKLIDLINKLDQNHVIN